MGLEGGGVKSLSSAALYLQVNFLSAAAFMLPFVNLCWDTRNKRKVLIIYLYFFTKSYQKEFDFFLAEI